MGNNRIGVNAEGGVCANRRTGLITSRTKGGTPCGPRLSAMLGFAAVAIALAIAPAAAGQGREKLEMYTVDGQRRARSLERPRASSSPACATRGGASEPTPS